MLSNFYFASPTWLLALFIIIVWFLLTRLKPFKTPNLIQTITVFYPLLMAVDKQPKKQLPQNNRLWVSVILLLLSLSLAQPTIKSPIKLTTNLKQGVDLILVVNTSVSMVLRDYKEVDNNGDTQQFDRMEKTKRVLKQLITQFKGQRIALVVLGRPSAVWLPLTGDIKQVTHAINNIKTTLGGRSNDVGAALALVKQQFTKTTQAQKMVLIVNDGYAQIGSQSPQQAVQELVENNFIVHTLAIGSPALPTFSLGIGHLIYSPVDLQLMQSLAETGKGSMVHAWKNKPVDELLRIIDQPIKQAQHSKTHFKNHPLYYYPLSLAMLLMLFLTMPLHQFTKRRVQHD